MSEQKMSEREDRVAKLDEEAKLATAGEFWQTGKKIAAERRRTEDVPVNTSYYGHQKQKMRFV